MIGMLDPSYKQATIIGGGISGLLCAYYLLQGGYKITLHEASAYLGGMIATNCVQEGVVEKAAHSFRSDYAISKLCQDLGINVIQSKTRRKFIFRRKKMRIFPLTIFETIITIWRVCTAKGRDHKTMQDWADHHLGSAGRHALITPLMQGIYACMPCDALQKLVFPKLSVSNTKTLLTHFISLQKSSSKPAMTAPEKGMGEIPKVLAEYVLAHPNADVRLNSYVTHLPHNPNIILCTPAYVAASLLEATCPITAQALSAIQYAPLVSATVFANKNKQFLSEGVGVLKAGDAALDALGVLFNSSAFPNRVHTQDLVSLSFMYGGTQAVSDVNLADEDIKQKIHKDFIDLFGFTADIQSIYVTKWPQALPVYNEAIESCWQVAQKNWCHKKGHILFGNYTGQISLRGLCDLASGLTTNMEETTYATK